MQTIPAPKHADTLKRERERERERENQCGELVCSTENDQYSAVTTSQD